MLEVFSLTLGKVGLLLSYIGIGYYFRRRHQLPDESGHVLSLLLTLLFLPCYTIRNYSQNMRAEVLVQKLTILGAGTVYMAAILVVGKLLGKIAGRSEMEKKSLTYAFTFSNYGYFGYPVIEGVFGSAMLADFMAFALPIGIACNSYGYVIFQKDKHFSLVRLLQIPTIAAVFIGSAIGLSGIQMPTIIDNVLAGAGGCMSPCSMLLAGFMLGKFSLEELLSGGRSYLMSGIRMVFIPVFFGIIAWVLGIRGQMLFLILLYACLPLGLNLVVYPESMGYDKDASDNAKMCFISYLLALIVLPCIFAVLVKISVLR